jgi:hypothetical protein
MLLRWFLRLRHKWALTMLIPPDLAGLGPKEVPTGFWPEAARVGEGGAPLAPGEPCASFGLGGFGGSSAVFSVGGLRGLPTFGTRCRLEHSLQKSPG